MAPRKRKRRVPAKKQKTAEAPLEGDLKGPDDLPNEGRTVESFIQWKAPLPPPQVIAQFDDVVENGAERVFSQFEIEAKHRRTMEANTVRSQFRDLLVGKNFALIFVLGMIITAVYAISEGYPWLAAFLGASVLGSVVWGFVRMVGDGRPENDRNQSR